MNTFLETFRVLQISFCIEIMLAALIYLLPMKKRFRWWWVLFVLLLPVLSVSPGILRPWEMLLLSVTESTYISVFFQMGFLIVLFRICGQVDWTEAVYAATCAYVTQHTASSMSALIAGRPYMEGGDTSTMLLSVVIYGLVYLFAYFYVSKPFADNWNYHKSTIQNILILSLVLLLALYLSLQCKIYCIDTRMFRICQAYDVLACAFWIWTQIQQYREFHAKAETVAERELWASRKAQYELAKENIALINRKCHDLKHEIAALRSMQDTKLLADSLSSIEQSIQIYDNTIQTGNRVLDTVLTEKSLLCEQEHITWTCMADGTLLDFMDPLELYTLLGNALDNAIEGVRQIQQVEQRVISVSLAAKGNCAHLQIENFYQGTLTVVQGLPLSTKESDGYHGYGLKSIQDIVERSGGSMAIHTVDNIFCLSILFPIRKNS
jgi:hypothetical protein